MADQENREYTLLEIWRGNAYSAQKTQKEANEFWAKYFTIEKGIYVEKEVNAIVQKAKERNERKSAGQAHPRRKERDSGRHPKV